MFLIIKLAVRNLARHKKRTMLLGFLITAGIAVLFTASAVFEGTNDGLQKTLINSLTGDLVIADAEGDIISLFGNELPIVSEYESIQPIASYTYLNDYLNSITGIEASASIVSTAAQVTIDGIRKTVPVFGIDPSTYFSVCTDLSVTSGEIFSSEEKGVLLNSVLAKSVETALGRPLLVGEPVQFRITEGTSFRLRTAPLKGIYSYTASNDALDRVILADLTTVRSLANYTLGNIESGNLEEEDGAEDLFEMDGLFDSDDDIQADAEDPFDLEGLKADLADTSVRDSIILADNGAWNFVLLKAESGNAAELNKSLKRTLPENLGVQILSWRKAAGNTALAIFAVQTVFNIGLGFLAFGAILVIMNSLVISVFERTSEIGTMRSLGAHSGFIRRLFITETMFLTMVAALLGIMIGAITVFIIQKMGLSIENPLLISLFGGKVIKSKISFNGILLHLGLSALVGALSWIYPVNLAMKVQPLSAMNSE